MSGERYTKDHEYVRLEGEIAVVGVTDYAQTQLGDIVFIELPEPGARLDKGGQLATIESVKAASEVYSPISGEVVAANDALDDEPASVNEDPLGKGWLAKLRIADAAELEGLMDEDAYRAFVESL
ncbi:MULTISPECIES: glycine cleavage system protein GcvH [Methylosinus]|uniref:Glycine cleavage system H protein n=1 Tax=Methylosinus trichosporium (strain ATCC 35070 / NCIMB 11131 / UNIQEM 75 / OB3b) TaxID=595536 RepID=A0A2D2D178_METT3|nr:MULTISPECIES: glycine cleavage system protein GcvH [Methylosinus]ATQ68755.1 glycine cleavage system protein H [Methylosinus trichosporium OB3b]OBS53084.1 glycine cleavage system protein H [Methylosinus sp. 3S-1]